MSDCQDVAALMVQEADGTIEAAAQGRLMAHLRECSACREELEAQRAVREVLRSRPAAPVPAGFEHRVARRLRPGSSWLPIADWRRWTLALSPLPVLLLVLRLGGVSVEDSSASTPIRWQAWEEATGPDAPVSSIVWQPGMTEESIFVAALTARPRETLQDFFEKHANER
ncbi:MAG: zf-HC2 domain-containing protein [Acidobacteria bacterium]|nr:zf-HC2 domain-containing protein [Acidobacteriota bacterium]